MRRFRLTGMLRGHRTSTPGSVARSEFAPIGPHPVSGHSLVVLLNGEIVTSVPLANLPVLDEGRVTTFGTFPNAVAVYVLPNDYVEALVGVPRGVDI